MTHTLEVQPGPDIQLKDSQYNHLRHLLAWMRCEFTLDENMQRGFLEGARGCIEFGADPESVSLVVRCKAEQINHVPAYVRHAHKMLTKALRDHEKAAGIVEENGATPVDQAAGVLEQDKKNPAPMDAVNGEPKA